jgi:hypothetical protein
MENKIFKELKFKISRVKFRRYKTQNRFGHPQELQPIFSSKSIQNQKKQKQTYFELMVSAT